MNSQLVKEDLGIQLITTINDIVLVTQSCCTDRLEPTNHQEADTRMFLHLKHASQQGHKKAYLRTEDTNVICIVISLSPELILTEL